MKSWNVIKFRENNMAAARGEKPFIEILANVLRLLILESISLREQLGNAIRIIVEKRRDVSDVSAFDKSLIFQLRPLFWLMAGGQWRHHFCRIAVECSDVGSDIKLDSMKLPSAMTLWGKSLDFSVSQMEGILSVFKFIGEKTLEGFGQCWD